MDLVLWDIKQTAAFLKGSEGAIRNKVLRRQIPFRKVGGRLMFIEHEIKAWAMNSPGVTLEELKKNGG